MLSNMYGHIVLPCLILAMALPALTSTTPNDNQSEVESLPIVWKCTGALANLSNHECRVLGSSPGCYTRNDGRGYYSCGELCNNAPVDDGITINTQAEQCRRYCETFMGTHCRPETQYPSTTKPPETTTTSTTPSTTVPTTTLRTTTLLTTTLLPPTLLTTTKGTTDTTKAAVLVKSTNTAVKVGMPVAAVVVIFVILAIVEFCLHRSTKCIFCCCCTRCPLTKCLRKCQRNDKKSINCSEESSMTVAEQETSRDAQTEPEVGDNGSIFP